MGNQRQCGCSSVSPFTHLAAKAFSFFSSLPHMTFMQLISLLLFAFFSLAYSHTTELSSYSSVAASSPQIYTLHEQEAPSITKPFIYETVLSSSPAGSFLMHAKFPQKKEALIPLDDGQDHASKEEAPISTPAFIYESVAASFSSRLCAEDGHRHDNVLPQDAEAALLDDGGKKEVAPSYIYESVIAATIPLRPPSSILHENVPQEENTIFIDDGTVNPIMQKEEDPIIAKPLFIYESVAASIHPKVHDAIRNNVLQEEHGFLLDDGGKHADTIEKGVKPISGKPFIYENVAAQFHIALNHAAGGSHLRDNVSQQENSFLLEDDGKHVHESQPAAAVASTQDGDELLQDNVPQEKYAFLCNHGRKMRISSIHHDTKAPPSLHDNVPQGKHAFLVDDGGMEHVGYDSPVASLKEVDVQFAKEEEHVLHDNASQGEYSSLLDDGRKELQSNKLLKDKDDNIKNHKTLPIYHKLLRMVVGDSSRNMQIKNGNEERLRMEEEGSSNKMIHEEPGVRDSKGKSNEEKLRIVVGDSSSKMVHKGEGVDGNPPDEEILRMVVGDSSNKMMQTGYKVQAGNPSKEENLRLMVVGDSSKSMDVQFKEGDGAGPHKSEDNLRMVKKGRFGGRLRLCTSLPDTCLELAHAAHTNHIALYGLPTTPNLKPNPACCGGLCVDLNSDQLNCGRCGQPCALLQTCCNGHCVDVNTDNLNCGHCGNSCPPLSPCQFGMCGY